MILLMTILVFTVSPLYASDSDCAYCDKTKALSKSTASLLYWPTLSVRGLRIPVKGGANGENLVMGDTFQVRTQLSISLIDIYKGVVTENIGRQDCNRHVAEMKLLDILEQSADIGRIPALRKQKDYYLSKKIEIREIIEHEQKRYDQRLTTVIEFNQLKIKSISIEKKMREILADLSYMEARDFRMPDEAVPMLIDSFLTSSLDFESESSHLRKIEPWQFDIAGGIVPSESIDWFAGIEISYKFGGISQHIYEKKYLAARKRELNSARYEITDRTRALLEHLSNTSRLLDEHKQLIKDQLDIFRIQKEKVAQTETVKKGMLLSLLELEIIDLEGELIYLEGMQKSRNLLLSVR